MNSLYTKKNCISLSIRQSKIFVSFFHGGVKKLCLILLKIHELIMLRHCCTPVFENGKNLYDRVVKSIIIKINFFVNVCALNILNSSNENSNTTTLSLLDYGESMLNLKCFVSRDLSSGNCKRSVNDFE